MGNLTSMTAERPQVGRSTTVMLLTLTFTVMIGDYVEAMILPAIPVIQKDFNTTPTLVAWTTSILLVVGTALVPVFSKLGDIRGKKKMLVISLGIYTIGVGVAWLAPTIYVLLFARAIQATGVVLAPLALAIVTDIFPKEKQALGQSVLGGAVAISTTSGYVLGSVVIQSVGWRDGFLTVLCASVLALVLAEIVLVEGPVARGSAIDYSGAFMLGAGVLFVLAYLTEGSSIGWSSLEDISLLLPGLGLLAVFPFFENRRTNPLIELRLLRIRNFFVSNTVRFLGGICNFLFYYPFVYFAEYPKPYGLGLGIESTGFILAPATLSVLGWALLYGKLIPKVGPRPVMLVGSGALIAGLALCILQRSSPVYFALDAIIFFSGLVPVLFSSVNMASLSLPKDQVTIGMGVNSMLGTLGQSFGPIIATTILVSYTEPLTKVVNGQTVVVGQIASPMAFSLIFGVGIVITCLVILASFFGRNYTFSKSESTSS